jgi:hypothetical protein
MSTMPEPAANHDLIEQASALFWNPPTLEALMADVVPLGPDEDFNIPEMTDAEWAAFLAALDS